MRLKSKSGFTLIETVVALMIIIVSVYTFSQISENLMKHQLKNRIKTQEMMEMKNQLDEVLYAEAQNVNPAEYDIQLSAVFYPDVNLKIKNLKVNKNNTTYYYTLSLKHNLLVPGTTAQVVPPTTTTTTTVAPPTTKVNVPPTTTRVTSPPPTTTRTTAPPTTTAPPAPIPINTTTTTQPQREIPQIDIVSGILDVETKVTTSQVSSFVYPGQRESKIYSAYAYETSKEQYIKKVHKYWYVSKKRYNIPYNHHEYMTHESELTKYYNGLRDNHKLITWGTRKQYKKELERDIQLVKNLSNERPVFPNDYTLIPVSPDSEYLDVNGISSLDGLGELGTSLYGRYIVFAVQIETVDGKLQNIVPSYVGTSFQRTLDKFGNRNKYTVKGAQKRLHTYTDTMFVDGVPFAESLYYRADANYYLLQENFKTLVFPLYNLMERGDPARRKTVQKQILGHFGSWGSDGSGDGDGTIKLEYDMNGLPFKSKRLVINSNFVGELDISGVRRKDVTIVVFGRNVQRDFIKFGRNVRGRRDMYQSVGRTGFGYQVLHRNGDEMMNLVNKSKSEIIEILIYKRTLSDGEINMLNKYFNDKYNPERR